MTPAVVEPATFRFVEQHLIHCATAVLRWQYVNLVAVGVIIIAPKLVTTLWNASLPRYDTTPYCWVH